MAKKLCQNLQENGVATLKTMKTIHTSSYECVMRFLNWLLTEAKIYEAKIYQETKKAAKMGKCAQKSQNPVLKLVVPKTRNRPCKTILQKKYKLVFIL